MPIINLIAEQRLAARQQEQKARSIVMIAIGIGACSFLGAGFFTFEAGRYQLRAMGLEAQKRKLKPLMDELEAAETRAAQLDPRVKTLETAVKDTERWSKILQHLTVNTPSGLWMTNVKCNNPAPDKPIVVEFQGYSVDQDKVGDLIVRLQTCASLEAVNLKYTNQRTSTKGKSIEFQVGATVFGTTPKDNKKKQKTDQEGGQS